MTIKSLLNSKSHLWLLLALALVLFAQVFRGFDFVLFDTDLGRDLKEISNIYLGNFVWLGPWLNPGLHASSTYYYLFYPAVFLSGFHPIGMVYMNLFLAFIAIALFSITFSHLKSSAVGLAAIIVGFLPWFMNVSAHPGNGFTYALLGFMAITATWNRFPLALQSNLYGWATSMHPGALVLLPVFVLKNIRAKKSPFTWVLTLISFLIPWSTLIGYELITKGFILRSFFNQPSTGGVQFLPNLSNIMSISQMMGIPLGVFALTGLLILFILYRIRNGPLFLLASYTAMLVVMVVFIGPMPDRYMFGIIILCTFVIYSTLIKKSWGKVLLIIYAVHLTLGSPLFVPRVKSERTIEEVVTIANSIDDQIILNKNNRIAVVSQIFGGTLTPQADDYRYLLRTKGYQILEVTQHSEADVLLLIIEDANFDWETWSNYEIESFGPKELMDSRQINGAWVALYKKAS